MIELVGLTRRFGDYVAVDQLDLVVRPGEVFAFLGPNGAGKTTTIKMMVGLLRPSAGQVLIHGIDAHSRPEEANRHVGYVPDQPYLYDKLSGREFLEFTARLYGWSPEAAERELDHQIEAFELGPFVDQLAEGYSHGMKQRLVFAAALVHRPEVLVVDEPMVGLDPRGMRRLKDLLRRRADDGVAVFMSTHTLSVAEEIADRIGIIDHGRLRFCGALAELRGELAGAEGSLERLFIELTN